MSRAVLSSLVFCLLVGCARARPASEVAAPGPGDEARFNHVFIALDADTVKAIEGSPSVRALAGTEQRSTAGSTGTWTGFYVYGRQTYLELFGPGGDAHPGDCGVGLTVERPGALQRWASAIRASGGAMKIDLQEQQHDGERIPWFYYGGLEGWPDDVPLALWVAESAPSYLARRLAPRTVVEGDLSRLTYLSNVFDASKQLENFSTVRLYAPFAERDRFEKAMRQLGWRVQRDGERASATDGESSVSVTGDFHRRGLELLELSLLAEASPHDEHLGRSMLTLGPGRKGRWVFEPATVP